MVKGVCKWKVLELFSLVFGYIILGFTEPLALISYILRAFRLKNIYNAQLIYFREERKPVELIERFKEGRLIKITAISVGTITIVYLFTAVILSFAPSGGSKLFYLPSLDTASFIEG